MSIGGAVLPVSHTMASSSKEDLTVLSMVYDFLKEKCSDAAKLVRKKTGVVSILDVNSFQSQRIQLFPEWDSDSSSTC